MSEGDAVRLRAPPACIPTLPELPPPAPPRSISTWLAAQEPIPAPAFESEAPAEHDTTAVSRSTHKVTPGDSWGHQRPAEAANIAAARPGLMRRIQAAQQYMRTAPRRQAVAPFRLPPPKALTADAVLAAAGTSSPDAACAICCASQSLTDLGPPSQWEPFVRLTAVDLSDNCLVSVAPLAGLPMLQHLNVSSNQLSQLWGPGAGSGNGLGRSQRQQSQQQQQSSCAASTFSTPRSGMTGGGTTEAAAAAAAAGPLSSQRSEGKYSRTGIGSTPGSVSSPRMQGGSSGDGPASSSSSSSGGAIESGSLRPQSSQSGSSSSRSVVGNATPGRSSSTGGAFVVPGGTTTTPLDVFQSLTWLDLSYNPLSGDQLLGPHSVLAPLPSLKHLAAAGCGLVQLPDQLGDFTSLTSLDLSHNKLSAGSFRPLGSLPALQVLQLAGNCCSNIPPTAAAPPSFPMLQLLGLAATKVKEVEAIAPALLQLQQLQRLWLGVTPLASLGSKRQALQEAVSSCSCRVDWSNPVVLTAEEPTPSSSAPAAGSPCGSPKRGGSSSSSNVGPSVPAASQAVAAKIQGQRTGLAMISSGVSIKPDICGRPVLTKAAARLAGAEQPLTHEALVGIFDRIDQDISEWKLSSIAEEESVCSESSSFAGAGSSSSGRTGQQQGGKTRRRGEAADGDTQEDITDHTFLTGVGITEDTEQQEDDCGGAMYGPHLPDDPTERLAVLLGLNPLLLAHHTGRVTGDTTAAIANLKFALAYPLVDPDAGLAPAPHHTTLTAAAKAKQRSKQTPSAPIRGTVLVRPTAVAVPKRTSDAGIMAEEAQAAAAQAETKTGLSSTLQTRVVPVVALQDLLAGMKARLQVLEGTLLQQLQEQAARMTSSYEEVVGSSDSL